MHLSTMSLNSLNMISLRFPSLFASRGVTSYGIGGLVAQCRKCSSRRDVTVRDLSPFGKLVLKADGTCAFNIEPADPVQYPGQDLAILDTPGNVNVTRSSDSVISVDARNNKNAKSTCNLQIPLKFGVRARLEGPASVKVTSLECDEINLKLKDGACDLRKIKCNSVSVETVTGKVSAEAGLHANGSITTATADIDIGNALGEQLHLECEKQGNIRIGSSYVNQLVAVTKAGHVVIGSCHRNAKIFVTEQGKISIGSLDGDLLAKVSDGGVEAHLSRHGDVDIEVTRGDVNIQVPRTVNTNVLLQASELEIDDAFDSDKLEYNEEDSRCTLKGPLRAVPGDSRQESDATVLMGPEGNMRIVAHSGRIDIKSADWLDTFKFDQRKRTQN